MNLVRQAGYEREIYERGMIRGMLWGCFTALICGTIVATSLINWHAVCQIAR